jgi:hypothetical protein
MASKTSLAIAQADALSRINKSIAHLAKERGRDPLPSLLLQGRDPAVANKNMMVSIADALEALTGAPKAKQKATDADRDTEESSAQDIDEKATRSTGTKAKR